MFANRIAARTAVVALSLLGASGAQAGPVDDARAAEARGDVAGAVAAWQRALEHAPGDNEAMLAVGRLQLKQGQVPQAVQTLTALVERAPATPRAHYWLAFALRKAGRLPEAAAQYREASVAAPDDPDPRFGLGETLKLMGDGPGAADAYRAYVRLESRPTEAKWVARANDEIARLGAEDAVTPSPAESSPEPATTPTAAAGASAGSAAPEAAGDPTTLFASGRYREARRALARQLERSPDSPALHHKAAVAALADGDYPEAERHATNMARLDPDNPTAVAVALAARARRPKPDAPTRADAELALRDARYRTAADVAGRLLMARPEAGEAAALARIRAVALLHLGRADEASDALRQAGGAGGSPARFWLDSGDAFADQGERPAARRAWRLAADLADASTPVGRAARDRLQPPATRVTEESEP